MKQRHHYVPRFYLKGFSDPRTRPDRGPSLWVQDINRTTIYKRAPGDLAVEIGYYSTDGEDPDRLENELSAIERRAAQGLRSFLDTPSGGQRTIPRDVGEFLAWLAARVPAFRRVAQEGYTDFLCNARWGADELPEASAQSVSLEHRRTGELRYQPLSAALSLLRSGDWIGVLEQAKLVDLIRLQAWYFRTEHLPELSWTLLTAPPRHSFITSDRPLVWFIPGAGFADSPSALRHAAVEVTVPLDQRHALLGLSRKAVTPVSMTVLQVNTRTACFSERFVAAPNPAPIQEAFDAIRALAVRSMHPT